MEINLIKGKIATVNVDALVISLFEDIKQLTGLAKTIDTSLEGGLVNLIKDGEITGKLGEMTLIHTLGKNTGRQNNNNWTRKKREVHS
jgi:leucyl aminopeptidase